MFFFILREVLNMCEIHQNLVYLFSLKFSCIIFIKYWQRLTIVSVNVAKTQVTFNYIGVWILSEKRNELEIRLFSTRYYLYVHVHWTVCDAPVDMAIVEYCSNDKYIST
jgi:hypothetical protein